MPASVLDLIKDATQKARALKKALDDVVNAELPEQGLDKDQRASVDELVDELGGLRKLSKGVKESAQTLKRVGRKERKTPKKPDRPSKKPGKKAEGNNDGEHDGEPDGGDKGGEERQGEQQGEQDEQQGEQDEQQGEQDEQQGGKDQQDGEQDKQQGEQEGEEVPKKRKPVEEDTPSKKQKTNKAVNIGDEDFLEVLREAMNAPPWLIKEWFELMSEPDGKNMWIDAARGLISVAPGINALPEDKIEDQVAAALSDRLKSEVLESLHKKKITELGAKDLLRYYKEIQNKRGALHRRSQVAMLQHIVLSIHTLKSSLAWAHLEKGHGPGGKSTTVKEAYEAECEEEGCEVDLTSKHFIAFKKSITNYNTGCNRFLAAYRQIGSILLLCPRLRVQRFADTHMGPKLADAVDALEMDEEDFKRWEKNHMHVLYATIKVLDPDGELAKVLDNVEDEVWE